MHAESPLRDVDGRRQPSRCVFSLAPHSRQPVRMGQCAHTASQMEIAQVLNSRLDDNHHVSRMTKCLTPAVTKMEPLETNGIRCID